MPGADEAAGEFKVKWGGAGDRWEEIAAERADRERAPNPGATRADVDDVPWDDLAEDTAPQFEGSSFIDRASTLLPDGDEDDSGAQPDDEAPPHGDPLDQQADEVFEGDRGPSARMDSLQDALSSIRERVQSLSSTVEGPGRGPAGSSQLALYRAATDDRTYAEVRRHSRETEEHLRRMAALMQDLSLDLRSIVDAARRAIDQTSEQAESSLELGRLLGERIEQMDEGLSARIDGVLGERIDLIDAAVGGLQVHLDKRLTKLEQRAGVGVLREEVGELRNDMSEVRAEIVHMRDDMGAVADAGGTELQERLAVVGSQLDRTLTILRDLVEGSPDQDGDMVEGVMGAIKAETEAAVEPFRNEVEQLGQLLSEALDREQQMGDTLATLTDEVQRLRKRIAVRSAPPTIDEDQIQSIVDAVVAALPGRRTASAPSSRRRAPEPEPDDELGVEPAPAPAPKARRKRAARPARTTKKAAPGAEPEYEVDMNEPFAPGDLDLDDEDAALDVEPEEEPIRRARGRGKKTTRPLTKGKRTRSSSS